MKTKAFTVVEILITLVIMGTIALVAIKTYHSYTINRAETLHRIAYNTIVETVHKMGESKYYASGDFLYPDVIEPLYTTGTAFGHLFCSFLNKKGAVTTSYCGTPSINNCRCTDLNGITYYIKGQMSAWGVDSIETNGFGSFFVNKNGFIGLY